MLIVYRAATGEVVDNSGTNSAFPDGPPEEYAYVNTDAAGLARADLALLRLNDETDAGLVAGILTRGATVVEGAVVLADAPPPPAPDPAPTAESLAAAVAAAQAAHDTQQQVLDDLKAQADALAAAPDPTPASSAA